MESILAAAAIAKVHCIIINPDDNSSNQLCREVEKASLRALSVRPAIIACTPQTSVDNFNDAITRGQLEQRDGSPINFDEDDVGERRAHRDENEHEGRTHEGRTADNATTEADRSISDVVVAQDLDRAPSDVQIQVIELLRMRRIFTRSAIQRAPKNFLLIATMSSPMARVQRHLNDMFAISYQPTTDDPDSLIRTPLEGGAVTGARLDKLQSAAESINLTAELDSYLHHIVLFMRNSRYVHGGVTATATRHFRAISKALAALHGLSFVTPTFVMQAARAIYLHRLVLATAETEKTLQWGSDQEAVASLLKDITARDVIEDVISSVQTPL